MTFWDYIVIVVSLILTFIIQYTILPMFGVINIAPDMVMGTSAAIGLLFGPFVAIGSGLFIGFFTDAVLGYSIGIRMLQLALIGFAAGMIRPMLRRENITVIMIVSLAGYFIAALVEFMIMYFMRISPSINGMFLLRILLSGMLTAAISFPIFLGLQAYYANPKRLRRVGGEY